MNIKSVLLVCTVLLMLMLAGCTPTCEDTDVPDWRNKGGNSNDVFVKGTMTQYYQGQQSSGPYIDQCNTQGTVLTENFCQINTGSFSGGVQGSHTQELVKSANFLCEYGCSDGACWKCISNQEFMSAEKGSSITFIHNTLGQKIISSRCSDDNRKVILVDCKKLTIAQSVEVKPKYEMSDFISEQTIDCPHGCSNGRCKTCSLDAAYGGTLPNCEELDSCKKWYYFTPIKSSGEKNIDRLIAITKCADHFKPIIPFFGNCIGANFMMDKYLLDQMGVNLPEGVIEAELTTMYIHNMVTGKDEAGFTISCTLDTDALKLWIYDLVK